MYCKNFCWNFKEIRVFLRQSKRNHFGDAVFDISLVNTVYSWLIDERRNQGCQNSFYLIKNLYHILYMTAMAFDFDIL